MTNQELLDRIEKKKEQIAKIEKRIAKWEKAKSGEEFIKREAQWYTSDVKSVKTFDDLIELRRQFDFTGNAVKYIEREFENYIIDCDNEIKYAKFDLDEANKTLTKYQDQLVANQEKAAIKKIPAIVEFLEAWKQRVIEFVNTDGLQSVLDYYEANRKEAYAFNNRWKNNITDDELKELRKAERIAFENMDKLSRSVYAKGSINQEALNKILDKDVEAKYFNLVKRIKEKAGEIIDASHLSVSQKGDLNGKVIGTTGSVRVETIPAAGYAIQRFHYRTLVKPIKG